MCYQESITIILLNMSVGDQLAGSVAQIKARHPTALASSVNYAHSVRRDANFCNIIYSHKTLYGHNVSVIAILQPHTADPTVSLIIQATSEPHLGLLSSLTA